MVTTLLETILAHISRSGASEEEAAAALASASATLPVLQLASEKRIYLGPRQ